MGTTVPVSVIPWRFTTPSPEQGRQAARRFLRATPTAGPLDRCRLLRSRWLLRRCQDARYTNLRDHYEHWPTDVLAWSDARTTGDRPRQDPKVLSGQVPARLRDQVRIEATVRGSSVTILECRPLWQGNLTEWFKVRVAQLRYSASMHDWSLYWADATTAGTDTTISRQAASTRYSGRSNPTQPASSSGNSNHLYTAG